MLTCRDAADEGGDAGGVAGGGAAVAPEKNPAAAGLSASRGSLRADDVGSLLAFRALRDFELDFLTFFEGLKTVHIDCGEVCEQILAAVIRGDEAKTFGIIEPLNSTCCHKITFD